MTRTRFDYYGPKPDPAWQAALDRIAPRTDTGHDHLQLVWEAGDPWSPVQRWVIYTMTPIWRVPMGIANELRGPAPRTFGFYDTSRKKFVRTRQSLINQQQWLLFQRYGYFGRPLWVIQGTQGGHLRRFTDVQSQISQMNGGPDEPAAPGELAYAEPDDRTIAKIKFLDVVEKYGDVLNLYAGNDEGVRLAHYELSQRERHIVYEMAQQLWKWLDSQVGEIELTRAQVSRIWDGASNRDVDLGEYETGEQDFVESIAYSNALM
jgi:hypothetical protein